MKKALKGTITIFMSLVMVLAVLPPFSATAAVDYTQAVEVSSIKSTNSSVEYAQISISGKSITVKYHSDINAYQYRIGASALDGSFTVLGYVDPVSDSTGNGFTTTVDASELPTGYHYLQIARARNSSQTSDLSNYGDGGNCYRNALVRVYSSGTIKLLRFDNIINNNKSYTNNAMKKTPSAYLDKTLSDVKFILEDENGNMNSLNSTQRSYIKSIADSLVSSSDSNYTKARKIYKYVSENTYYDVYSNTTAHDTILSPYYNLRSIKSGKKTATVCTGYSAMMISLLRMVGVPTRLVFGFHLSVPKETWLTIRPSSSITNVTDHYWTEFYDGSRWVMCDATVGTSNKWQREYKTDKGEYIGGNRTGATSTEKSHNNYTYFDPTDEQLAVTHFVQGIYSRALISEATDVARLSAFLNQKNSAGVSNATKLGAPSSSYSSSQSILSWDSDNFYTSGKTGNVEKMGWSGTSSADKGLSGAVDFSGLRGLRILSLSYNKGLTSLNLNNDSQLTQAYASSCSIRTVEATGCSSLTTLNVGYNPLTSARYSFNSGKTANITAQSGGTFFVTMEGTTHNMTARPNDGYYFLGWYNSSGDKVSTSLSYTKKATSGFTLVAKFKRLAAPTNVKVSIASATGQKVSWDKVPGASGYNIYKSESKNGTYVKSSVSGANTTSIVKTGLTCGKTYYYYVEAYKNSDGKAIKGAASNVVSRKVVPPTPKVTLKAEKKAVTVSCPKIANVNGYEVCRSTSKSGEYKVIKTFTKNAASSTISYKDTKVKAKTTYYYKVRTYKTVGGKKIYSSYSSVKSVKAK